MELHLSGCLFSLVVRTILLIQDTVQDVGRRHSVLSLNDRGASILPGADFLRPLRTTAPAIPLELCKNSPPLNGERRQACSANAAMAGLINKGSLSRTLVSVAKSTILGRSPVVARRWSDL